jgi:hypothetical protein
LHVPGVGGSPFGFGRARRQLKVAVAVCIVPSTLVASAMMVAEPLAKAVTIPAVAPTHGVVAGGVVGGHPFEFTGKLLGKEEIHLSEESFVRSLTYGTVEKVPIARNCPVSKISPTEITLGTTVNESRGSGAVVSETAMVAVEVTTLPSGLVNWAEMVVLPALRPVARPDELIEAMEGALELHWSCDALVTFMLLPVLPDVPSAINCAV